MSEVTEVTVSDAHRSKLTFAPHWSALHRALHFLSTAEQYATPVHATMAFAAAGVSLAFCFTVSMAFLILAAPLSIVAGTLTGGAIVKARRKRKRPRVRRRRSMLATSSKWTLRLENALPAGADQSPRLRKRLRAVDRGA